MAENLAHIAAAHRDPEEAEVVESDQDSCGSPYAGSGSSIELLRRHSHRCTRLSLREHIAAYCEKRELIRPEFSQPIDCDTSIVEKVMSNYLIVKKILSHLCWQDRMVCKIVCTTWRSAVCALRKEQLYPVDFVFDLNFDPDESRCIVKSSEPNEPLAVFAFTTVAGFALALDCSDMQPQLCQTPCINKSHSLLDVLRYLMAKPKKCMMATSAPNVIYMPLPESSTSPYTLSRLTENPEAFIGGIHIPVIPGVKFHVLTIRQTNRVINTQNDFYNVIDKLAPDHCFKGMLVFVTEKYILQTTEDLSFLNRVKELQPDVPYALAGCIVEDTLYEDSNYELLADLIAQDCPYNCEDIISIGLFTVPKVPTEKQDSQNFEMYSVVIESGDWTRPKIQQCINEFASKVPQFEHSCAFKLSCTGRDKKHKYEQECFRAAFPETPLVGCYGNGELGINHPARPPTDELDSCKRRKRNTERQSILYSYSTVFMYIGWGKILGPPRSFPANTTKPSASAKKKA